MKKIKVNITKTVVRNLWKDLLNLEPTKKLIIVGLNNDNSLSLNLVTHSGAYTYLTKTAHLYTTNIPDTWDYYSLFAVDYDDINTLYDGGYDKFYELVKSMLKGVEDRINNFKVNNSMSYTIGLPSKYWQQTDIREDILEKLNINYEILSEYLNGYSYRRKFINTLQINYIKELF